MWATITKGRVSPTGDQFFDGNLTFGSNRTYTWNGPPNGTWNTATFYSQVKIAPLTTNAGLRMVPLEFGGGVLNASLDNYKYAMVCKEINGNANALSWYIGGDGVWGTRGAQIISAVIRKIGGSFTSYHNGTFEFIGPFHVQDSDTGVKSGMHMVRCDVGGPAYMGRGVAQSDGGYFLLTGVSQTEANYAVLNDGTMQWFSAASNLAHAGNSIAKLPENMTLTGSLISLAPDTTNAALNLTGSLRADGNMTITGELQGARVAYHFEGNSASPDYLEVGEPHMLSPGAGKTFNATYGLVMPRAGTVVDVAALLRCSGYNSGATARVQVLKSNTTVAMSSNSTNFTTTGLNTVINSQVRVDALANSNFNAGEILQVRLDFQNFNGTITDIVGQVGVQFAT